MVALSPTADAGEALSVADGGCGLPVADAGDASSVEQAETAAGMRAIARHTAAPPTRARTRQPGRRRPPPGDDAGATASPTSWLPATSERPFV